jgi:hypothetical protein
MDSHAAEVAQGQPFDFGKTPSWILPALADAKIEQAPVKDMPGGSWGIGLLQAGGGGSA